MTQRTRNRLEALEKRRPQRHTPHGIAAWYRDLEADPGLMNAFYRGSP